MDLPNKAIPPAVLSTAQLLSGAGLAANLNSGVAMASFAWPAANQAIYIPFANEYYYPVNRIFWVNGSIVTGNYDFGIYTLDGARIYSTGSIAQSGASAVQYVTPTTPFILPPGMYYFALANDGTTNRGFGYSAGITTNEGRLAGLLQQATALPLPASATFAQWASAVAPLCGITKRTS